jgi:hypothetical protein
VYAYVQGKRPAGLKLANQAVQLLQKAGGRDKLMAEVSCAEEVPNAH